MTQYREEFAFPVAFPEQPVDLVLADVLEQHRVRQLHAAETEKYAHVTYFFNGGREERPRGRIGCSCRRRATCRPTTSSRRCRPRS